MSGESTFFYFFALVLLWALSLLGGIVVALSWISVGAEYDEEGLLIRSSQYAIRSRALLTAGCMVFWICTILGYSLSDSSHTPDFAFWQNHPSILVALVLIADLPLVVSVVFSWKGRGSGRWILSIGAPIPAFASLFASFLLYMSAFASSPSSF
jgi:hypothetical protein